MPNLLSIETRAIQGLELREADTTKFPGSIGVLEGYAAKFNTTSKVMRGKNNEAFVETIASGAFKRSLTVMDDQHDVRAFAHHDKTQILARRSAGTLEITEDAVGLKVRMHLVDTTTGRDTLANVKAGNLDSMSFGFKPVKTSLSKRSADNLTVRELKDVDLAEVSVVTWAAYADTELSAREFDLRTVENTLSNLEVLKLRQSQLELRGVAEVLGASATDQDAQTVIAKDYTNTKKYALHRTTMAQAASDTAQTLGSSNVPHTEKQAAHQKACEAHWDAASAHAAACNKAPDIKSVADHRAESARHQSLGSSHARCGYSC